MFGELMSAAQLRQIRRRMAAVHFPLDAASTRRARRLIEEDLPALIEAYQDAELRNGFASLVTRLRNAGAVPSEGTGDGPEAEDDEDLWDLSDELMELEAQAEADAERIARLHERIDQLVAETRGESVAMRKAERCTATSTMHPNAYFCYPEESVQDRCGKLRDHNLGPVDADDRWHECNRCGIGWISEGEPGFDDELDDGDAAEQPDGVDPNSDHPEPK